MIRPLSLVAFMASSSGQQPQRWHPIRHKVLHGMLQGLIHPWLKTQMTQHRLVALHSLVSGSAIVVVLYARRKMQLRTALALAGLAALPILAGAQTKAEGLRPIATVTLTEGAYPEIFENDTLRWVGNALFNTRLGVVVEVRNGECVYRFGFQGQEKDDEIHGATGTSYSFQYRMHDPRVGRFLSIDPLAAKYPFYSPYVFSGNRVIDAKELEGLEPGVLFGSPTQVESVNGTPGNVNYIGIALTTMVDARIALINHRQLGNSIKVVYLQTHGNMGVVSLGEGRDGFLDTRGSTAANLHITDDIQITSEDVDRFANIQPFADGLVQGPLGADDAAWSGSNQYKAIDSFVKMANETDADATIVLGSCYTARDMSVQATGYESNGSGLLSGLSRLTGRTVVGNSDRTSDRNPATGTALDAGRTSTEGFSGGWSTSSPGGDVTKTGGNLQLNSTGAPYEFKKP